jgi:hypothetical protein
MNMKKKILFSAVEGQVFFKGKPVANLEIQQRVSWHGVHGEDHTTVTNHKGGYTFAAITSRKMQPLREKDIFIWQSLTTRYNDQEIVLWQTTKYNFRQQGELGGRDIKMRHELTAESRNYMIPTFGDYDTNLDGVFELDHPYVRGLDSGFTYVQEHQEALQAQLLQQINSTDEIDRLNMVLVHPLLQPHAIVRIENISASEFKWPNLVENPLSDQVSLAENDFIRFTISANVGLTLANGIAVQAKLYWPKATVRLPDAEVKRPQLLGDFTTVSLDNRELLKNGASARLNEAKLAQLAGHVLANSPNPEAAYVLDDNLSLADLIYDNKELPKGYKPGFQLADLKLTDVDVSYVKTDLDYISVWVQGNVLPLGHQKPYSLTFYLCLKLSALADNTYEIVRNEDCNLRFDLTTFAFELEMSKSEYTANEPLTLEFRVLNLLPKQNIFLNWHTPFEGFRNEFLDIVHVESGREIEYNGILASRAAPTKANGSYIEFIGGETKSTTIDLREAYNFTEKGRYFVRFKPLSGKKGEDSGSTEFILK